MAKKSTARINEGQLTKGQIRKLTALRKSLGQDIADKAFLEWLSTVSNEGDTQVDRNAQLIAEALEPLRKNKKLKLPRGGYLVKSGRGRVIVELATAR